MAERTAWRQVVTTELWAWAEGADVQVTYHQNTKILRHSTPDPKRIVENIVLLVEKTWGPKHHAPCSAELDARTETSSAHFARKEKQLFFLQIHTVDEAGQHSAFRVGDAVLNHSVSDAHTQRSFTLQPGTWVALEMSPAPRAYSLLHVVVPAGTKPSKIGLHAVVARCLATHTRDNSDLALHRVLSHQLTSRQRIVSRSLS